MELSMACLRNRTEAGWLETSDRGGKLMSSVQSLLFKGWTQGGEWHVED